jgi:uncharacterized SAM-binding protein YcdF (DUF218 family)
MAMEHPFRKKSGASLSRVLLALLVLYLAGFGVYVLSLPKVSAAAPSPDTNADAIVALTGGDARLETAVALLESGVGKRLLITGVHPQTKKEELKERLHGGARFDCCADLGFTATDTRGNAREAALWARQNGYDNLIVVTAAYHMPRSFLEFANAMPDVRLTPYPVEIDAADPANGWDLKTLRILNGEYVKYAASLARVAIEHATEPQAKADPQSKSAGR